MEKTALNSDSPSAAATRMKQVPGVSSFLPTPKFTALSLNASKNLKKNISNLNSLSIHHKNTYTTITQKMSKYII